MEFKCIYVNNFVYEWVVFVAIFLILFIMALNCYCKLCNFTGIGAKSMMLWSPEPLFLF